jgi:hypothetical protein
MAHGKSVPGRASRRKIVHDAMNSSPFSAYQSVLIATEHIAGYFAAATEKFRGNVARATAFRMELREAGLKINHGQPFPR